MTDVAAFSMHQLQRTVDVFNTHVGLLQLVEVGLGPELISLSLPFSSGALLVQLFPDATADVLVVGEPPRDACTQLASLCSAIGHT